MVYEPSIIARTFMSRPRRVAGMPRTDLLGMLCQKAHNVNPRRFGSECARSIRVAREKLCTVAVAFRPGMLFT